MRRTPILLLAASVALFGAGCFKPLLSMQQVVPPPAPEPTSTPAGYPTFPKPAPPAKTPKEELADALKAFANAKSFRAKIVAPVYNGGNMIATMEFARPDRMHAVIEGGQTSTTDMVVVANDVYVSVGRSEYLKIGNSASAEKFTQLMTSAMSGSDKAGGVTLGDDVTVDKTKDAMHGCDAYEVTSSADASKTTTICVSDGLPKHIEIPTDGGTETVDYFDYNDIIVIARPY